MEKSEVGLCVIVGPNEYVREGQIPLLLCLGCTCKNILFFQQF